MDGLNLRRCHTVHCEEIREMMQQKTHIPNCMTGKKFHYCPGCHHSIIHRLVGEAVDTLDIRDKTVGIAPVGCSVLLYDYFNFDVIEVAHGRAPAVATGMKRAKPDLFVFCYQGDGDLASIGMAEIIHAANRGENISVIFINNANYGMTGGQMAPTTLLGQKTQTTPYGRSAKDSGYPLRVCELLATLDGTYFIARSSVHNPKKLKKTKSYIKKCFENQIRGLGFSMVEILSACPVNWHMTPLKACEWIEEEMTEVFPLGIFKGEAIL